MGMQPGFQQQQMGGVNYQMQQMFVLPFFVPRFLAVSLTCLSQLSPGRLVSQLVRSRRAQRSTASFGSELAAVECWAAAPR